MLALDALIALVGFVFGLSFFTNLKRGKLHWQGQLTDNRLLTRYPVLIIPGRRSIFYFKNYYNLLPSFLAEHGYEVFHLNLPWKKNRSQALKKFLASAAKAQKKFHVLAHPTVLAEFTQELATSPTCILSQTSYSSSPSPFQQQLIEKILKLFNPFHSFFTQQDLNLTELGPFTINSNESFSSLMDKLQKLAETDFIKGQNHERCHEQQQF